MMMILSTEPSKLANELNLVMTPQIDLVLLHSAFPMQFLKTFVPFKTSICEEVHVRSGQPLMGEFYITEKHSA